MRAPLAPIGWPSATAPPCTLTISCASLNSVIAAIVTAANASLTSQRSTSLTFQPVFFSTFWIAPTGAVVNMFGAWAWTLWPTILAIGFAPRRAAVDSRIRTSAAAPSEMLDEVAAVIVPSFLNAAFRPGILSSLALNGCSSNLMTVSPDLPGIVTGAISQAKLPSSLAFFERSVELIANWSIASRVKLYLATHSSAKTPIERPRS